MIPLVDFYQNLTKMKTNIAHPWYSINSDTTAYTTDFILVMCHNEEWRETGQSFLWKGP